MTPHPPAPRDATEMRDVWAWALSWFLKPPASAEKRARQRLLVGALLAELRSVRSVAELHERYCQDSRWALRVARERFPQEWPTLGVHATTATAFGVRYVELLTNRRLAPTALPKWVSEWAVW